MNNLPKLTEKENKCLMRFYANGYKKIEAYRYAYNCSNMKAASIYVEASRFFKNPKITLWMDYYRENTTKAIQEELNYTAVDYFNDCEELKLIALECKDKQGNPNVAAAIKADENKAKVCGLFKEDSAVNNSIVVKMGDVEVDGIPFDMNIGEEVNNEPEQSEITKNT